MSAQTTGTQQITLEVAARPSWADGYDQVAIRGTRAAKRIHAPDLSSDEPESLCRTDGRFQAVELEANYPFRPLCKCQKCSEYWEEQGVADE